MNMLRHITLHYRILSLYMHRLRRFPVFNFQFRYFSDIFDIAIGMR